MSEQVEVHVAPVNDVVEHDTHGHECLCGPSVQAGPNGVAVIHHSMDGREFRDPEHQIN